MTSPLGPSLTVTGVRFAVRSHDAAALTLCLFDGEAESRIAMTRMEDGVHVAEVPGLTSGARYGLRAEGEWAPERGLWFDPAKLLLDPYATEIDRRFAYDERLAAPRGVGPDTAALMPKAIVPEPLPARDPAPPLFRPGGLIYELNVRGFTMRHPDVPQAARGTVGALAHPAVIAHLQRLGVAAVELMPITAAIDERHLVALGLANAWGYNPVGLMALDPRLCPGGVRELRDTVAALRAAGIGTILDLVFNHSGESDAEGPILSLRGLDNRLYYATEPGQPARLLNYAGTGNMLACWRPEVRDLVLDSLRHFVRAAGVDGFRFDLAPVIARTPDGFDPGSPIFAAIAADPPLRDRIMIAEPWDVGPGGYQLGGFPSPWLEWNDRFRDDVRRFWRGDGGLAGRIATRLAGSSDIFARGRAAATRSVNYVASHDGFTLADLVAHAAKHNEANGEGNRDGQNDNCSWNNGVEGSSDDPAVLAARAADLRALLATLFASRGTIMLTAGDEFGRSQQGNNNAYAQDNPLGWVDWAAKDEALLAFVEGLAAIRAGEPLLRGTGFLDRDPEVARVEWRTLDGDPLDAAGWDRADGFELILTGADEGQVGIRLDRVRRRVAVTPARRAARAEAGGTLHAHP